jgi:hypothetical protein
MFDGRKVNHILPYESPASNGKNTDDVKTEVTMENLSLLL